MPALDDTGAAERNLARSIVVCVICVACVIDGTGDRTLERQESRTRSHPLNDTVHNHTVGIGIGADQLIDRGLPADAMSYA